MLEHDVVASELASRRSMGVDPQSRVRLLDLVREEARRGACVLFTTHSMEEAESLLHGESVRYWA